MTSHITISLEDRILTITLNRPDKLNAFTPQMGYELADAFDQASENDDVRVVIVTGAGRSFCAGFDLSAGAESFDSAAFGGNEGPRIAARWVEAIFNCKKPSICAINGHAVGLGLTMTLPMDIRLVAEGAKLGFVFTRRGLVPEAAGAWFLPRLVGMQQALRWCLSGSVFGAQEALKGGLVYEVLAPDDLMARAQAIAREIADNTAPVAVALTRQLLWRFSGEPEPGPLLSIDGALSAELGAGADVAEGVVSFLEKRPPRFPGKASTDIPQPYPWWNTH